MDPVAFTSSGAVAPPSADQPAQISDPSLGAGIPSGFPDPTQTAPVAASPDAAALPPLGSTPSPTAPAASPPEPDYRSLYQQSEQQRQQTEQEAQQLRAFQQQFQQALAQAETQAQEQERAQAAQSRIDQAQQVAASLAPEDGMAYLRRVYDAELGRERQEKVQIAQQAQVQQQQVIERLTAPLYAQHLARTHGLPAEYADRLATLQDGRQMDAYLPVIKAEHAKAEQAQRERQDLLTQLDQLRRSMQAGQLANSGAHLAPGGGTNPALPQGGAVDWREPNSLFRESGVAELLGLRQ